MDEILQTQPLSDVEESDSFRSIEFVTAGTQHVDMQLIHLNRDLAKCLYRIGVE